MKLPPPRTKGGRPLLDVLKARRSCREFSDRAIEIQVISDLLWAAFGVNRPEDGHRTAPSARNWQEIDIYVALAQGLYRFDATQGQLEPVLGEDMRPHTGLQDFVAKVPLDLVFVADHEKMQGANAQERDFYAAADAGFIAQNVYLFCASEGLATVVRGMINRPALAKRIGLRPMQRIILAQSVGYPA
jgi:nitroreductase